MLFKFLDVNIEEPLTRTIKVYLLFDFANFKSNMLDCASKFTFHFNHFETILFKFFCICVLLLNLCFHYLVDTESLFLTVFPMSCTV